MILFDTDSAGKRVGNFWNGIHFHPTDAIEDDWGKRILDEIAEDRAADTVRLYAMLEDIVTRAPDGTLAYDFSLCDRRLDYLTEKGFGLLISFNFMPACMAENAALLSAQAKNRTRYKGKMIITSPPRDYGEWEEVCHVTAEHLLQRYGEEQVSHWYLQCWNEPDISAFFMGDVPNTDAGENLRLREYLRLYAAFAHGVKRVSQRFLIGQSLACELPFLDGFLRTAKETGLPLDFISLHTYGTSVWELNRPGGKRFHAENTVRVYDEYRKVTDAYFPELPVIIDEWGASSQGFCNREECPALLFREDSGFAAYFCKMVAAYLRENARIEKMMICLSGQHEMTVDFSGFRNFFTLHHIRKPIYNAYVLMGKLRERVLLQYTDGPLTALGTVSDDGETAVLALAYAHETFSEPLPPRTETIVFRGFQGEKTVTVWLIDETHTNPYRLALRFGWGDGEYTEEQLAILREEGRLKPFSVRKQDFDREQEVSVTLGSNALCLIEVR